MTPQRLRQIATLLEEMPELKMIGISADRVQVDSQCNWRASITARVAVLCQTSMAVHLGWTIEGIEFVVVVPVKHLSSLAGLDLYDTTGPLVLGSGAALVRP